MWLHDKQKGGSLISFWKYFNHKNNSENIFFSSYGIFTAMAMAYEGAGGQKAKSSGDYFESEYNVLC